MAITAKSRLPSITPNQKKRKVTRMVTSEPMAIILNEMSRWVRFTFCIHLALAFQLLGCQTYGSLDDAPALDDADDTSHGNTADTDAAGIGTEDLLRSHGSYGSRCNGRVPGIEHADHGKSDSYQERSATILRQRAQTGIEGILETHDVAQTEHGSTRIHLEHKLCLVGKVAAPYRYTACEVLVPPSEACHDEVVQDHPPVRL